MKLFQRIEGLISDRNNKILEATDKESVCSEYKDISTYLLKQHIGFFDRTSKQSVNCLHM